jgi:ABC-type uncharacterized transport system auxiliary subunit
MKAGIVIPAVTLCLGMLTSCGAVRPSKYYELTAAGNGAIVTNSAPYPVTLLVGRITTSDLYRDNQIIYTSSGQAMGAYEYHKWAEPPFEMIGDVLLRELQTSGRYRDVYPLRSDVRGDYFLRGNLYELREVDGNVLAARVAFKFELQDTKTRSIVWSHYYSHDETVNGKDVAAVVAAMDRNVQSGLGEVMAGLDRYFSARTAATSAAAR